VSNVRDGPTATGERTTRQSPVVVLTYAHAGAELLTETLSASPALACTSGTGLLPLCHEALSTWQRAEGASSAPSHLAIKSVRALAITIVTTIQAQAGASRWCETAFASPDVAHTFLQVFPGSTLICLHRSLPGVFSEAARTYPWGLGGSPFWAFAAGHPGNNVATIAAYWVARTEALLGFEAKHPDCSLRLRYEDLAAEPGVRGREILTALGLDASDLTAQSHLPGLPCAQPSAGYGTTLPTDRIPPPLLTRIKDLHRVLGYDSWQE
jgi:Sulfotransferase family